MTAIRPKQAGFYMPAEWHPHSGCWMAWPCHAATWQHIGLERAQKAYANVAKAIAQYEPVWMLVNPLERAKAQQLCGANIKLIDLVLDDSWTRDTGASFLVNQQGQLGGVDWLHNAWGGNYESYANDQEIAAFMLQQTKAQRFEAPLIMEGGAFHVDGEGTLLTSRECLLNANRNPHLSQQQIEQYLGDYLGITQFIWLNKGLVGDETDGHIDEIATFIAPGKVLCLITHDKKDANYSILQENLAMLKDSRDAKGRALEVFTVEQPPATKLNNKRLTLSYVNFYLANQGIVLPAFGHATHDEAAYKLFQKLFPGYGVTQINALDVFAGGGGIHCITQQQPRCVILQ